MSGGTGFLARKGEGLGWPPPPQPSDEHTLNVALYPFLPDPQAFVAAVWLMWRGLNTGFDLNFCEYDLYHVLPPKTMDVFAFDCIFTDDLIAEGCVELIPASSIDHFSDIEGYAADAALSARGEDKGKYAGIPYLGCTAVLIYRASDKDLDLDAHPTLSLEELRNILGPADHVGPRPPQGKGLLIDLTSKTTDACNYAAIWRETHETFWPSSFPMPNPAELEEGSLRGLRMLCEAAGSTQAQYFDSGHDRVSWLTNGYGRALVGLTETMSGFDADVLETLAFRPLPSRISGAGQNHVFCYADAIGMRPGIEGTEGDKKAAAKKVAALQLCNVIASHEVSLAALMPTSHGAQYLMPARRSVLDELATRSQGFQKYTRIRAMLEDNHPMPFRLGKDVGRWAKDAGQQIIREFFGREAEEALELAQVDRSTDWRTTPAGLWRRE